ncbi:MAG: D-glycero-beta-D-manno-heptose 1-phosphate adenylyltransferase [Fidelibacterota bacterium]
MSIKKILTKDECKERIRIDQQEGKKVVFTNGCFDVLHVGHLTLLEKAKSFGDRLCVGINSDASVKILKGENRPINSQEDRTRLLAALYVVDYVTVFDEQTPCEIISFLRPDIHVKGGDYDPNDFDNMPEAKVVKEYGGTIKIINLVEGKSSSNIIKQL